MKDIVIVPTFDRPEFLWVALEHLKRADGIDDKQIWICEDMHADKPKGFTIEMEMLATIREAVRTFGYENVIYYGRHPHTTYGNSSNLIEAFRDAYDTDARFVYIVEDDVMVTKDFFQWHEKAQEQFKPFVTCAGRINRSLNFQMNGSEAIDESCRDAMACVRSHKAYMSWATCFKRESLRPLLECDPTDRLDLLWKPGFEQDMFIQDFIRDTHADSIWPYVPRAFHLGWRSYHRNAGLELNGNLEEKVKQLRETMTSKQKIRNVALLQDDIDPYPQAPIVWGEGDFYLKADHK